MIKVRVDLVYSHNRDSDRTIYRGEWPQVPLIGESINLSGDPYIIHERGWATDDEDQLYSYLRVSTYQYGQRTVEDILKDETNEL